jgi:hypothetical protein
MRLAPPVVVAAALLVLALSGCASAPAADPVAPPPRVGPHALLVAGHYAELWSRPGARGTVLLLPHAGWAANGSGAVRDLRRAARHFVAMGYRALSISYAPGMRGLQSVAAGWRIARRHGPACVYGESSGAHWALVLATRDRSVRCVIAAAAPTDLVSWPAEIRSRGVRRVAVQLRDAAFGTRRRTLERYSPVDQWPRDGCARLLLITARNDQIVPLAQARELQDRVPRAQIVRQRAGTAKWVHSSVRPGDLAASWRTVRRLLAAPPARC